MKRFSQLLTVWPLGLLILCVLMRAAQPARAQSALSVNNLIVNGDFDEGGFSWSKTDGGGPYFYKDEIPKPANETNTIASFGWWTGCGLRQNIKFSQSMGSFLHPNLDCVLTIRARTGDGQMGGFSLSFQDPMQGWTTLTNADFYFPAVDKGLVPGPFRVFSFLFNSSSLASLTGNELGVTIACKTNPAWGQSSGWLHVDWLQLAPALPIFIAQPKSVATTTGSTVSFAVKALGAVTNASSHGKLAYQWFKSPATPLAHQTNGILTMTKVRAADAGDYYVVASSSFGTNRSEMATLTLGTPLVTIQPKTVIVENFDGWGTSLCWWAHVVGGYTNRSAYAKLAFSTLKLNIVRYNIGGGENPSLTKFLSFRTLIPGFQSSDGVWNWAADANQRWMLRQAVALGADRVVAFANSPPWWMTVSGSVTGSKNGSDDNLQPKYEPAFAAYLATVVSNLSVLDGIRFNLVTPINEPIGNWWRYGGGQEGCHMSPGQQARMIGLLRGELDALGQTPGIAASEDNTEWDTVASLGGYSAASLSNVTLIASHTYGANNPDGLRNLAQSVAKPLWISEYGDGDATGLLMARRIRDDIVQTGARAWIYWQVVDNSGGWGLLYNSLDGSGDTTIVVNPKFHMLWQFSNFIRPGFQIISAGDSRSLAAYNPTNQTLVIVAVNDTTNAPSIHYDLSNFTNVGKQASCYRTSTTEKAATLDSITLTNRGFITTLARESVTTFVITSVVAPNRK